MEVKDITNRDVDFAKWYTDVCKKADLVDYSSVKGSMIIRPLGYAIWEEMQKVLDRMFKETGHENVQMPMFIPESLLNIEKKNTLKVLLQKLHGLLMGEMKNLKKECV